MGKFDSNDVKIIVDLLDHPLLGWGFTNPRRWIAKRATLSRKHKVLDVGCGGPRLKLFAAIGMGLIG